MKKIIALIGNANIDNDKVKQIISFELGKLIIDNDYILATGGLGGVMEYASKGAKSSEKYTENSIIGVLPDYHTENANQFIDIAFPTGLGLGRNLMLISLSNAVIAVGGSSGTLNEISAAWQMNKLLIGMKVGGWSDKICGSSLDKRRNDVIFCAKTAKQAIEIINQKIDYYQQSKFSGVKKPRINKTKASNVVVEFHKLKKQIDFLGKGSEGFVFTDKEFIYKLIDNTEQKLELNWTLSSLSESLKKHREINSIPNFEVSFYQKQYILIKYEFEKTIKFTESHNISIDQFIKLMKDFKKLKWTLSDFKPQNIRVKDSGELLVIDFGKSFLPTSNYLFKSMCRRAYVTYKLQGKIQQEQEFKKYLSSVSKFADFTLMSEFGFSEIELQTEFDDFYNKIVNEDKKDVLNPVIKDIFKNHINVKSVFDYGSGYGDMSRLISDLGKRVIAYEPDESIVEKYKSKYYGNIQCLSYHQTQNLIKENKKFDSVLCSLVLCHPLAETEKKRLNIINQIMSDLTNLSDKYIVLVVCNPLYTYQSRSSMQTRILPNNFNYYKITRLTKKIFSSGNERYDIHRPVSFYENLFETYELEIVEILQTQDITNNKAVINSDFMIFILSKSK